MERVCAPAMYPTATPTAALQNVHPIQNKINQLLWALSCTYCRYSSDLITFTGYGEREREFYLLKMISVTVEITEVEWRAPDFTVFLNVRQT